MSVEEQIKTFITRNILFSQNGYPYNENDSLLENGIIDSMGIMVLIAFIEDTFKFSVEDQEITPTNFDSVTRLADYIRKKSKLQDE